MIAVKSLSKSRVMAGLQCHKQLWWRVHEPWAPELQADASREARFAKGLRVGEVARRYVPGGVLVGVPSSADRLAATREALERGVPVLYEASFRADHVYVSADILERRAQGFALVEVKSSTKVRGHDIDDVAIQAHVLRRSGVDVTRMEIMHLNRDCTYPELDALFLRQDVTEAAEARRQRIAEGIQAQLAALAGPLPQVALGQHCRKPYECPFIGRCRPPNHVRTLHGIGKRAKALEEQGITTIQRVPPDFPLGAAADRQRRVVQSGTMVVEPGLARALEAFVPPIAFLDFETVSPAMPVWKGCRPRQKVPVQFSCHVQEMDGRVTHHEWLADGCEDPRPTLAEQVIRACESAGTVVAYGAGFERQCLEQMACALPALSAPLLEISAGLVDLLPVVRNHVYHPDFGGGFGLKQVLPALVSGLDYADLAIKDGEMASAELERLLFQGPELSDDAKARLRTDLLRYCCRDSMALVRLLGRLRELARG